VVEDRSIISAVYCLPLLAKCDPSPAARFLCDSWVTCLFYPNFPSSVRTRQSIITVMFMGNLLLACFT